MDLGASREGAMASDEVSLVTERVRHVSIISSFLERMLAISRNGGVGGAKEGDWPGQSSSVRHPPWTRR